MWTGQLHEGVSVHLGVREQAPPTFRRIMRARRLCKGVAAGGQLSREWWRCRRWRHGFAVLQHLGLLAALQLLTHLLHTTNPHGGSYVVWCSLPPHCCTWLTHLAPACHYQLFCLKPVLNWTNVCSPEHTSDTSTNYDSFLN